MHVWNWSFFWNLDFLGARNPESSTTAAVPISAVFFSCRTINSSLTPLGLTSPTATHTVSDSRVPKMAQYRSPPPWQQIQQKQKGEIDTYLAFKNEPHVVDLCRLTFERRRGGTKSLISQPQFLHIFRRLLSSLRPVCESCRQAVLRVALLWHVLYIAT